MAGEVDYSDNEVEVEELYRNHARMGMRPLHGMTLNGEQFMLDGTFAHIYNEHNIQQTKGIVQLTIAPTYRNDFIDVKGDGIFVYRTDLCRQKFVIDRPGIYDMSGNIIYKPELPGIINILVILGRSHERYIHTYRPPPNVVIIFSRSITAHDCGIKVHVHDEQIQRSLAFLTGLSYGYKGDNAMYKAGHHDLFTKDALRATLQLATKVKKTPDDPLQIRDHDLNEYNFNTMVVPQPSEPMTTRNTVTTSNQPTLTGSKRKRETNSKPKESWKHFL
jgi:hypothetical protein